MLRLLFFIQNLLPRRPAGQSRKFALAATDPVEVALVLGITCISIASLCFGVAWALPRLSDLIDFSAIRDGSMVRVEEIKVTAFRVAELVFKVLGAFWAFLTLPFALLARTIPE